MSLPARTARERGRASLLGDIKRVARRQLAEQGAGALSLRAVARELGLVSSALYRYFPSRDALLTALIIDAYDGLAEATEAAETASAGSEPTERWLAACRALRAWAHASPAEYALLYGSPDTQYRAPADTVAPATRVYAVLARLLPLAPPELPQPNLPAALQSDLQRDADELASQLPPELMARTLLAATAVFGLVSFEVFGHYTNIITDLDTWFELSVTALARS